MSECIQTSGPGLIIVGRREIKNILKPTVGIETSK
jgi:hypothetical protein